MLIGSILPVSGPIRVSGVTTPQPGAPAAPATTPPGSGLALAGLLLGVFVAPVGIILSAVALAQARRGGTGRGLALAGLIVGIVMTVAAVVGVVLAVVWTVAGIMCGESGQACELVGG
jgi:hypothetical protein